MTREQSPSYDSLFGGSDHDSLFGGSDHEVSLENTNSDENEKSPIDASLVPASILEKDPKYGLAWVEDGVSLRPTWTVQPTVESIIATLKAAIGSDRDYEVRFLHEGACSKLYDVAFEDQLFVMRINLPVCPRSKTESEIATLDWVCRHTRLPVPRVKAYDSSRNNPLGFEWILMTKIEGKPLSGCFISMKIGSKERLVKQIATFSADAFQQPFRGGLGSIYKATPKLDSCAHIVGEMVSMALF
jgi:hypothetical protein